ncbi:putative portal protein [Ralstonia phage phiRSP]|uniref:Putative portal protein n=1 Tax=Ralstonia phage phiRSP TaxID=2201420 RepID=A0A345ANS9_9CAUD|nr:portal protein [Ralstonia phage phiRSP]AXF38218.1 putative portal protein [Ralstonia phage phiRSP]
MKFPNLFGRSAAPTQATQQDAPRTKRRFLGRTIGQMFKASLTTSNDRWGGTPVSPDVFISLYQPVLVARSREQWSNNDYVRNFVRLVRQNVVGPQGVTLQAKVKTPRGKSDGEANAALEDAWGEWCAKGNCDVTGTLSFREIENLVMETTARDGEFIARKVYGRDAGPMGFALQLLDPQRLSVRYENYKYGDQGNFIRQGIEFNRYGRPVAYHFTSTDEWNAYYYSINGQGFERVPADEIIHGFVHEMVGQRRGLPWASTSLFRLHHLQGYEDAAVQNARASASKMGFIEYESGFGPECDDGTSAAATIDAAPLSFHELPMGAKLAEWNPQYPSGEFAVFNKAMLRGAAAGFGVLYNNLAGDLEGVNFSSIRQGTLDEREHWKELQQWLIETLVAPVYEEWLKFSLLAGAIKSKGRPLPADKLAAYRKVDWQGRRWAWIDPRADNDGNISAMRAGLKSPSQIIRESGRDPEDVFREFADDLQAMRDAGIDEDTIELFMTGQPPAPEPEPAEPDDKTTKVDE